MTEVIGFKEDKKELIKENLKIKNQLQIVNSEYENIKRIYNNLLEEYLDLQFEENFDKVMIIHDEVGVLKRNNSNLNEELERLKDELNILKTKEKELNFGQIKILNEENENLKLELREKEEKLNYLSGEIKSFTEEQESMTILMEETTKGKEELLEENLSLKVEIEEIIEELQEIRGNEEKNNQKIVEAIKNNDKVIELKEFINELQSEFEKMEYENYKREEKLNLQINEILEQNKGQEKKYQMLEEEFEKTLENLDLLEKEKNNFEEKNQELQKNMNENYEYLEILQVDLEKNVNYLNEMKITESQLKDKIVNIEKSKEKTENVLFEIQTELKDRLDELKNIKDINKELNEKNYNLQKNIEENSLEMEEIKNQLNITEKRLQNEIENNNKLEQKYIKTVHKNYDFKLMTHKMLSKFIEEQNELRKTIKILKIKEKIHVELEKVIVNQPKLEQNFKISGHKEHRVNIRNIFGKEEKIEEKSDILGSIINGLEKRKEFHPYKTEDVKKEEKIGEIIFIEEKIQLIEDQHIGFEEVPLDNMVVSPEEGLAHDLKEIYGFENSNNKIENDFENFTQEEIKYDFSEVNETNNEVFEENYLKEEFENLFKEKKLEEINEEIINVDNRYFVKNKDLFTGEKVEEFTDFLKFMLPRTVEDNVPLLEKDMLYFMVSFAFYNYNGENFWDLLLDKLEVSFEEKPKYENYLREELNKVFKTYNFYQLKDEKGYRVGASIVMHAMVPFIQIDEHLSFIKNIYTTDLKGVLDKNRFSEILLNKFEEEEFYKTIKSLIYLEKSNNIDTFIEYSFEILKTIDMKSKAAKSNNENINYLINEKIDKLIEKAVVVKKNRFNFESFYGFGKK